MGRWRFGLCPALLGALLVVLPGQGRAQEDTSATPRLQEDAGHHLQTGHARLKAGDLKGAEEAFKSALSSGGKARAAEAYNGLGLVYAARPSQLQTAVYYFQKALNRDPRYVEAHVNKAQTYFAHNWLPHAVRAVEQALGVDSTHAAARQLLEKCRLKQAEQDRRAREAYETYLKSRPDDLKGWLEWGKYALDEKAYAQVLQRIPPLIEAHPDWRELLPILAQACWRQNLLPKAWDTFQGYFAGLAERERSLYEDIRLVCPKPEADAYERASGEGRKALARRFWTERDPDFTTPANERLLEHYRRVWYARTYFSKRRFPWDRRGDVYVRYGPPDHRSRSGAPSPPVTTSVNAVKERAYNRIYDDMRALLAMGGGKESLSFDRESNPGTDTGVLWFEGVTGGLTGSLTGPVFPVRSYAPDAPGGVYLPIGSTDFSIVPWESWVYADVDGGIVIDFTDEVGRGAFDYAPVPELGKTPGLRHQNSAGTDAIRALAGLARQAPNVVMRKAVSVVPERYAPPAEDRSLDFYFDHATFRGEGGASRLEVYYGIPTSETAYSPEEGRSDLRATCRIALAGKGGGAVYRSETELVYREAGDRTRSAGVIPHIARLEAPPGDYRLDVRVENRLNGRVGSYRKRLTVESYPAGPLRLSDVQLAWKVSEGQGESRFARQGLQVIPMPTRLYGKGQPVVVYYEIYNLARDESGRASYTVEHTIRSGNAPGIISQMVRSFQGKKGDQEVSVTQERLGLRETETQHLELDLKGVAPGRVTVKVVVTDLIGNQTSSKEAVFQVGE
ncbi:MAG: GWxTD domain-containing protein [Candidatus Latescibacteria bacterium]|nr:GWxTD domain-containing protein [Candidatus Latescibacterota bacterium]